jgi:hypothetical protein
MSRSLLFILALATGIALFALPSGSASAAGTGSISGVLTAGGNGPSGDFCFFGAQAYDSEGDLAASDDIVSTGDYVIDELEPGDYRLKFSFACVWIDENWVVTPAGNSLEEFYDDETSLEAATPVTVTADSDTGDVDAHLGSGEPPPRGSISGTITDSSGTVLNTVCVTAFDADGAEQGSAVISDGNYTVHGLATGDYRLRFSRCGGFGDNVLTEFYEDEETLAAAKPVSVVDRANTPNIDAQLDLAGSISGPVTDLEPDPSGPVARAAISDVSVNGPAKAKRDRKAVYRVKITNSGNAEATGVKLNAKGRGVSFSDAAGTIPAGTTERFRVKLKPRKAGKVKVTFEVTAANAGAGSAVKRLTVKR